MDKLLFPFQYSAIPYVGRIFTPIIPIRLKTINGVAKFNFLVDTGADLTTLPHFMASRLRIDLKKEKQSVAEGLGGFRVKTWLVKISLIFPNNELAVRASITDENSTPFLLGRVDLLDVVYSWNFSTRQKKIIFEPI